MSDKLKKLMHRKIDEMNDVFSNIDQFFQQFDFYHSSIYDLIISILQEDSYNQNNIDLQFKQNFSETQKIQNSHFNNSKTIKVQSTNFPNQGQDQHVNNMINSGKQISSNLRNILEQYINEMEKQDKTNYYNEKNKKLKQKIQNLQTKIESLQQENFDLKIENTKLVKVDDQILQNQKSFITTYNEQGVDQESYQKVKDKNFVLEKQNYFLQLQISTLENQLSQIQVKSQTLQKSVSELQEEYLQLYKTTQKAISNNDIDVQSQFNFNEDTILQNQTGFTEISHIQNDRKKSDIDPILVDKILTQQNELLQFFHSEDRKENQTDQIDDKHTINLQSVKETEYNEDDNQDSNNIDTKQKFEELFSEKQFLDNHATKKQSDEKFNKSQESYNSKEVSEDDDQDLYNTQQEHKRKDSEDKHILKGFGNLGSFRSPVIQNEVQANIKKIKHSLRNTPLDQQKKRVEDFEDYKEEQSEARFSIVEMRNSKEENDDGFFNHENLFLNQFFLQCKEQEDKYINQKEDENDKESLDVKDIQIKEPPRKKSKFRTKVEIF